MRHLLILLGASVAAFAAPALTAHAPRPAGAAVGQVSGFRISDVSFTLGDDRPNRVRRVSFAFDPPTARTIRVALGESRTSCRVHAGRAVCTFTASAPQLHDLAGLTVLAAS